MSDKGFSLVELLIAVVIVGVLIAVAVPSLIGSRRAVSEQTVKARLMDLAARQEAYRTALGKRRYATNWDALKVALPNGKFLVTDQDKHLGGWTIAESEMTAETFKFEAARDDGSGARYCVFEDGVLRRAQSGACARDGAPITDF